MKHLFLILLLTISISAAAQKESLQSRWNSSDLVIDGAGNEWTEEPLFTSDKLSYSISNDSENLNLLIQSFNRNVHQKIIRSGITVTLSLKKNSKKKLIVNYPIRSSSQNEPRRQPGQQNMAAGGQPVNRNIRTRSSLEGRFVDMKIKGFDRADGLITIPNDLGINASVNYESTLLLTYELQIPISELIGELNINELAENEIELKIQVNGIPQSSGAGGRSGGGNRGGGGSRGGGGMPPGGRSMGPAGNSTMSVSDIFKSKFVLSITE